MEKIIKYLRLTAAKFMIQHPEVARVGGLDRDGKSIYVLINEIECGRRKFNKGKYRKTVWTLGAVEKPDKTHAKDYIPKCFAMTVPDRSRKTLIPILKNRIHKKSKIWSDGWRSYFCLNDHFEEWDYVNHSVTFKDPTTGVCTNCLEGFGVG